MNISIQRSCSSYGRDALVAEVMESILAFGIWRRMSHNTAQVPFEALDIRKVNEFITREFGGENNHFFNPYVVSRQDNTDERTLFARCTSSATTFGILSRIPQELALHERR